MLVSFLTNAILGVLKKPGDRKKQVQAQSLFFTAFALLAQLIRFSTAPFYQIFDSRATTTKIYFYYVEGAGVLVPREMENEGNIYL